MTKLSQNILKKIKDAHIKPRPKWQFIAMHATLWIIVVISIIFGSLATSVIFRILSGTDWEVARMAGKNPIHSFALILPYVWFVFLGLIILVGSKLFSKTKAGYRHKPIFIVLTSVLISLIIGIGLYLAGVGNIVQKKLITNVGPYADWQQTRNQIMSAPERGVLVGKIIKINPQKQLMVVDFKSQKWTVNISNTKFKNSIKPRIHVVVGVLGQKTGQDTFQANRIVPWKREFIHIPRNR